MNKLKLKLNQRGFSLIELMVVVVIIGLLAAVAIPNFQRFQRKARQTEVKTVLSALYTAERAFISEWSFGTTNLDLIGYDSTGELFYVAGWHTGDKIEQGNTINAITGQPNRYRGPVPSSSAATDHVNTLETEGAAAFHVDADHTVSLSRSQTCSNSDTGANHDCCEVSGGNCRKITAANASCAAGPFGTASCGYVSTGVDNRVPGNNIAFTITGRANLGGADDDEWTIDNTKALRNPLSGL